MPEIRPQTIVERVRRRLRVRAVVLAATCGLVLAVAVDAVAWILGSSNGLRWFGAGAGGLLLIVWLVRAYRLTTLGHAAAVIEQSGSFDNLIVTAIELIDRPRPVAAPIREEIATQAEAKLATVDVAGVVPLQQPLLILVAVSVGVIAMLPRTAATAKGALPISGKGAVAATLGIDRVSVEVTPPGYSQRPVTTETNPVQISVVAGSTVRLMVTTSAFGVTTELAGQAPLALVRDEGGFSGEWVADRSTAVAIRPEGGAGSQARFLSVMVVPDLPPVVRVPTPGRDLGIAGTTGRIAIAVDAQDDLGLAEVSLKFTKASGGGEALTFTEGAVPLVITRVNPRQWRATAEWVLDGLNLADGDVLVYRAIARDRNPNGQPVQSDQFLIEVGRRAGAIGSGFALPDQEKKYAISQQMVIYKTEQLIAARAKHATDWLEQNQLLGIEQRMVRAEVVFLGGGEVQDEVEEAAHSHEVAEGRLENTGRAEMLRAINFMSRAEVELNAGRAVEAVVLEREALRSLERAFDRRRYFLRTLPERSRIDTSRRLTGALKEAQPWTREPVRTKAPSDLEQRRALMRDLAAAASFGSGADAALAARVAALDPSATSLQQSAVALASAKGDQARRAAAWGAMQAVTTHALASVEAPALLELAVDPLAGLLGDRWKHPEGPRH